MRAYETSHPWLTFSIDLSRAPARLWTMLGECGALSGMISSAPLPPEERVMIDRDCLVSAVKAVLPGNVSGLTDDEIRGVLAHDYDPSPSRKYLFQEVENLIAAVGRIDDKAGIPLGTDIGIDTLREYNELVLDRLVLSEGIEPGGYRINADSSQDDTEPAPAEDCDYLLASLCDWLNSGSFSAHSSMTIYFGILKAVLARFYLAWIRPFGAGNERTTALVEHHLMVASGVPSTAALLATAHYSRTRREYIRLLSSAKSNDGKILPFIRYGIQGFIEGSRDLLASIMKKQEESLWDGHIRRVFGDRTSPADIRRRQLAIELSRYGDIISVSRILDEFPSLAASYALRTYKTLTRDVNDLAALGLLEKTPDGIRVPRETIRGLPPS